MHTYLWTLNKMSSLFLWNKVYIEHILEKKSFLGAIEKIKIISNWVTLSFHCAFNS